MIEWWITSMLGDDLRWISDGLTRADVFIYIYIYKYVLYLHIYIYTYINIYTYCIYDYICICIYDIYIYTYINMIQDRFIRFNIVLYGRILIQNGHLQ